jgi:predicted ATP-grasp superfamily ATP-dependent carboligase
LATILLTGGRAPATLELARVFHRAGHRVMMAESLSWHLSRPSRAVAANYQVPPPRQRPVEFIQALAAIMRRERVDLLVPTCEEIYTVAGGRDALAAGGACVFAASLEQLRGLHDKWLFAQRARGYGLSVPDTRCLESADDLRAALAEGGEVVLKPAYSRFAARTRLPPHSAAALAGARPSPGERWVAQALVSGREICTYSVAHQGRLAAHAAYPVEFTAGRGATVAFRAIEHPAARAWVERFVAAEQFTGQIAFDFIETAAGEVTALECNPRATSGLHLLAGAPGLASAFFGPARDVITPAAARPAMLAAGMLLYSLPAVRSRAAWRRWWAAVSGSRDVVFCWDDPLPALLQLLSLAPLAAVSRRRHLSLIEASTYDIEWNG